MTFTQLLQRAQQHGFQFIEEEGCYPIPLNEFLETEDLDELDQIMKVQVHNLTSDPATFVVAVMDGRFTEQVRFTLTK